MRELPPEAGEVVEPGLAVAREAFGVDLRSLALFGSRARGDTRESSDADFVVVVGRTIDDAYARLATAKLALGTIEPPFLSFVVWSVAELARHPWLLIDVATDGILVLDDGTLAREMETVRERLRAYGSRRVRLPDGTWYWDLKPDWRPGDRVEI